MRGDGTSGPDTASGDPDKKTRRSTWGRDIFLRTFRRARVKVAEQKSLESRWKVAGKLLESR